MKKNLVILISSFLIICIFVAYFVLNYRQAKIDAQINNKEYNTYYNQSILGTTLVTIINKTVDNNEKNNIEKDEKNNYIENEENSIKIYICFLDEEGKLTNRYLMEQIYNKETEKFIDLYGTSHFLCTNIEYHKKTGNIKSLTFEQQIY